MVEDISAHHLRVEVNPSLIRSNEVKVLQGDNSRLRSAIGGMPFYDFKDTLREMFQA